MTRSKWKEVKPKLDQLTDWIAEGEQVKDICDPKNHMLPIKTTTFYEYIKKHADFADAIKKGRERIKDTVEASLRSKLVPHERTETIVEQWNENGKVKKHVKKRTYIVEADTTVLIFMAKNHLPHKYYDRNGSPKKEKLLYRKINSEINRNKSQTKLQDKLKTRPIIISDISKDDDENVDTKD